MKKALFTMFVYGFFILSLGGLKAHAGWYTDYSSPAWYPNSSYNNGYNIAIPANCVMLGRNHSEKTKEILREKSKGNKNMLGKKHTEQTKNKIKEKLK